MIDFDKYFQNCFGQGRSPGTNTEHCEQVLPASKVDPSMAAYKISSMATGALGMSAKVADTQAKFLNTMISPPASNDPKLADMVDDAEAFLQQVQAGSNRFFVLGPTGSGGHIRHED